MASDQLDQLWDQWMDRASKGFIRTVELLDDGKPAEARDVYKSTAVPAIKDLYAEAAQTYPERFAALGDWCAWTRTLYILTRQTEEALDDGDRDKALHVLAELRGHFHALHRDSGTMRAKDYLYLFWMALQEPKPAVEELEEYQRKVIETEPALEDPDTYHAMRDEWRHKTERLLEKTNSDTVGRIKRWRMTRVTRDFYRAYGLPFD